MEIPRRQFRAPKGLTHPLKTPTGHLAAAST